MFSTTETTAKQKEILATHYFFVAQGALGLKPNLRLFMKQDSGSAELWNEMRAELNSIEAFCRTRCRELSPEATKVMEAGAAELTTILKKADQ